MAPGYEQFDENGVPLVMRLLKSLYGLRQSPTNWWNTIDTHVVEIGFKSLKSDPFFYTCSECGAIYILTLYVDDVLLLGKDVLVLRRIKQKLTSRFSMTDMGNVSLVIGMGVTRDREKGTVTITQEKSPSPCWSGTVWQAGLRRTRLVWEKSCRWTSWRRDY